MECSVIRRRTERKQQRRQRQLGQRSPHLGPLRLFDFTLESAFSLQVPNKDFALRNPFYPLSQLLPASLAELHAGDDSYLESLISPISAASSDYECRPRTSTAHPAPEEIANTPQLGKPLPRNLRQNSPTECCVQFFAFSGFLVLSLFGSSGFWLGRGWSGGRGLVARCARMSRFWWMSRFPESYVTCLPRAPSCP